VKLDANEGKLEPDNLKTVREMLKSGQADVHYQGLLCAIADCLDTAIRGGDVYLTIGLTKPRNALIMTVHDGSMRGYAGGLRLSELSKDAEKLL
jgi:hypothetical protein